MSPYEVIRVGQSASGAQPQPSRQTIVNLLGIIIQALSLLASVVSFSFFLKAYEFYQWYGPIVFMFAMLLLAISLAVFYISMRLWRTFGRGSRRLIIIRIVRVRLMVLLGLLVLLYIAVLLYSYDRYWGPFLSSYFSYRVEQNIGAIIHSGLWISYDPVDFNRCACHCPCKEPNPQVMALELQRIFEQGFSGIITFSSRDARSEIPELAKKNKLSVIMGIWDPSDPAEIEQALSRSDYVDAYAVGHNGLPSRYSYLQLAKAVGYLRFHARRPVSTTEPITLYTEHSSLLRIGDWLFPDAQVSVEHTEAAAGPTARVVAENAWTLARMEHSGRPVLLKMVTYPMRGDGASEQGQKAFFETLFDIRDRELPGVSISVHAAFDQLWKSDRRECHRPWEPYIGVLNPDGSPREAATFFRVTIQVSVARGRVVGSAARRW